MQIRRRLRFTFLRQLFKRLRIRQKRASDGRKINQANNVDRWPETQPLLSADYDSYRWETFSRFSPSSYGYGIPAVSGQPANLRIEPSSAGDETVLNHDKQISNGFESKIIDTDDGKLEVIILKRYPSKSKTNHLIRNPGQQKPIVTLIPTTNSTPTASYRKVQEHCEPVEKFSVDCSIQQNKMNENFQKKNKTNIENQKITDLNRQKSVRVKPTTPYRKVESDGRDDDFWKEQDRKAFRKKISETAQNKLPQLKVDRDVYIDSLENRQVTVNTITTPTSACCTAKNCLCQKLENQPVKVYTNYPDGYDSKGSKVRIPASQMKTALEKPSIAVKSKSGKNTDIEDSVSQSTGRKCSKLRFKNKLGKANLDTALSQHDAHKDSDNIDHPVYDEENENTVNDLSYSRKLFKKQKRKRRVFSKKNRFTNKFHKQSDGYQHLEDSSNMPDFYNELQLAEEDKRTGKHIPKQYKLI